MDKLDWRGDSETRRLQAEAEALEGTLKEALAEAQQAMREATLAEDERARAERSMLGQRTPPDVAIKAAVAAEAARARAADASRAAVALQARLEALRSELAEATRRAKSRVLPQHRRAFGRLAEEYGEALRAVAKAEQALRAYHTVLQGQFPEGGSRPAGMGLPVFLRHWPLTDEGIAYWQRWRDECFAEPAPPKPPTRIERPLPEPVFEDRTYSGQAVTKVRLTR